MKRSLQFELVSVMTACGVEVAHSKEYQGVNFPEQVQSPGALDNAHLAAQLFEQGFGLLEVGRVKALRKPAVALR
jgi:hypothetical protein